VGASLLDQSFLSGLGTFMDALNDPQQYAGRWLTMFAQGFVPFSGAMRNAAQAVDPAVRKPEGVKEAVQSIIPGVSDRLPARRDRFGDVVTRPGGPLRRGVLVPEVSRARTDEVTRTLARLQIRPVAPRGELVDKGLDVKLTRAQQDLLIEAIGRERKAALDRVILRDGFQALEDEQQEKRIRAELEETGTDVRARARRLARREAPWTLDALLSPATKARLRADTAAGVAFIGDGGGAAGR